MKLCIDGGPLENTHRDRGIGTFTAALLDSLTPDLLQRKQVDATLLMRRPVGADGPGHWLRWERRAPRAHWTAGQSRYVAALAEYWKCVESGVSLPREVSRIRPDVFFTPDPRAIGLSPRFRTVAMLYDLIPLLFPTQYLPRRAVLRRAAYRYELSSAGRAAHLIAISDSTRRDAIRLMGWDPKRISVVHLGVDPVAFPVCDPETARAEVAREVGVERPFFVYLGGFDPRKNVAALIDAFLHLAQTDSEIELLLAGGLDGPGERLRRATVGRSGSERIRWLGYVPIEKVPVLYAGARAMVFPSLYEGFGLPVLEAMSCGAAVVGVAASSVPEIAGDAALLVPTGTAEELADAMRRVSDQPDLAAELRERGQVRAQGFAWSRTAEAVLDICRLASDGMPAVA